MKQATPASWRKGQSGNPKGRPMEEESLTWLMKQYLKQPNNGDTAKTNKQVFIEKAYQKAVRDGDAASIKLIWNYIDGLPKGDLGEGSNVQFFIDLGQNAKN
jgi:hypothetical protein